MQSSIHESGSDIGSDRQSAMMQRPTSHLRILCSRLLHHPQIRIGLLMFGSISFLAVLAPLLPIKDPTVMFDNRLLESPDAVFWLGTDLYGRDILSRVIWGGRAALGVGVLAVTLGVAVGVPIGIISGYYEGAADSIINRILDTILAFPSILVGIAVAAALGAGLTNAAIAAGIVSLPVFSRLARACVLAEKQKEYVIACRAIGATDWRIMFRAILPNAAIPLIVQITVSMAYAVILEGSLSFLGVGTQPPDPSWGNMLKEARPYLATAPWYALSPGIALSVLLVGLNCIGDGIRDVLDPTQSASLKG